LFCTTSTGLWLGRNLCPSGFICVSLASLACLAGKMARKWLLPARFRGKSGLAGIGLCDARKAKFEARKNVQKKENNLLTVPWIPAIVSAHTVNTYYIER
jgi:hypothetical protein